MLMFQFDILIVCWFSSMSRNADLETLYCLLIFLCISGQGFEDSLQSQAVF